MKIILLVYSTSVFAFKRCFGYKDRRTENLRKIHPEMKKSPYLMHLEKLSQIVNPASTMEPKESIGRVSETNNSLNEEILNGRNVNDSTILESNKATFYISSSSEGNDVNKQEQNLQSECHEDYYSERIMMRQRN